MPKGRSSEVAHGSHLEPPSPASSSHTTECPPGPFVVNDWNRSVAQVAALAKELRQLRDRNPSRRLSATRAVRQSRVSIRTVLAGLWSKPADGPKGNAPPRGRRGHVGLQPVACTECAKPQEEGEGGALVRCCMEGCCRAPPSPYLPPGAAPMCSPVRTTQCVQAPVRNGPSAGVASPGVRYGSGGRVCAGAKPGPQQAVACPPLTLKRFH